MNANLEQLTEKYGREEALKRLAEIRDIGGYGDIPLESVGGFDVMGALDPSNNILPESTKDRIAELAGVDRKEADAKVEAGQTFLDKKAKGNVTTKDEMEARAKGAVLPHDQKETVGNR